MQCNSFLDKSCLIYSFKEFPWLLPCLFSALWLSQNLLSQIGKRPSWLRIFLRYRSSKSCKGFVRIFRTFSDNFSTNVVSLTSIFKSVFLCDFPLGLNVGSVKNMIWYVPVGIHCWLSFQENESAISSTSWNQSNHSDFLSLHIKIIQKIQGVTI